STEPWRFPCRAATTATTRSRWAPLKATARASNRARTDRVAARPRRSRTGWGIPLPSASLERPIGCKLDLYALFARRGRREPHPIHGLVAADDLLGAPGGLGPPRCRAGGRHPRWTPGHPGRESGAVPEDAEDRRHRSPHPVPLVREAAAGPGHRPGRGDLPATVLPQARPGPPDPPGRRGPCTGGLHLGSALGATASTASHAQ